MNRLLTALSSLLSAIAEHWKEGDKMPKIVIVLIAVAAISFSATYCAVQNHGTYNPSLDVSGTSDAVTGAANEALEIEDAGEIWNDEARFMEQH